MSAVSPLSKIPVMGALDDSPRGRVLRAAAHLFRTQGYERTTVRDLARVVGIQSGSLFHHFKTKEDILCAVMEEGIRFNHERMREAVATGKGPREQLRNLILAELESILGETGDAMTVLVYEWNSVTPERQNELLKMRGDYEAFWLDVLGDAKQLGLLRHDPFITRRLLAGAIGWTRTWYKRKGPVTLAQLAEMVLEMALGPQ
ncbi:MAG: TetR/AcrR family transcriptional regulator [Moraxellaceae bacterium]|jgi:AcrR family transcriptional regulator|nr:TetR/AcrR family transcriptional regulator [Moraxellaceae bacterium]